MGASGLETDAWLTADGQVVLDHDGAVRRGLRRRPISGMGRDELPSDIPTLEELYAECGTAFELSVDVKDAAAGPAVVAVARAASPGAPKRLWLCHPDRHLLAEWREQEPDVRLVNSVRAREVKGGLEKRAADLAATNIDAINLHCTEWTGGLTVLFHRFERLAFAWDAQQEREIRDLVRMGIDGVHSDHVDRLVAVLGPRP